MNHTLDLLPQAFQRSQTIRSTLRIWAWVTIGGALLIGAATSFQVIAASEIEAGLNSRSNEIVTIQTVQKQLQQSRNQLQNIKASIRNLSLYKFPNEALRVMLVIGTVARSMDDELQVTSIQHTEQVEGNTKPRPQAGPPAQAGPPEPPRLVRVVNFEGTAAGDQTLHDFIEELQRVKLFDTIDLQSAIAIQSEVEEEDSIFRRTRKSFRIRASFETPLTAVDAPAT